MIWKLILEFALLMALTAFFVTWAKLEEQKQKTKEEHECYEAMLRLHNGVAVRSQELAESLEREKETLESWKHEYDVIREEKNVLQDRLSASLCPSNNHVWKDGKCIKCGRNEE